MRLLKVLNPVLFLDGRKNCYSLVQHQYQPYYFIFFNNIKNMLIFEVLFSPISVLCHFYKNILVLVYKYGLFSSLKCEQQPGLFKGTVCCTEDKGTCWALVIPYRWNRSASHVVQPRTCGYLRNYLLPYHQTAGSESSSIFTFLHELAC